MPHSTNTNDAGSPTSARHFILSKIGQAGKVKATTRRGALELIEGQKAHISNILKATPAWSVKCHPRVNDLRKEIDAWLVK